MNQALNAALSEIASVHGTPLYVYSLEAIDERIEELRNAFTGVFRISYAMKANPNSHVIELMQRRVEYLDVSSEGEVRRALAAGWDPDRISFTGPGKRTEELLQAMSLGVGEIVVESVDEAKDVDAIANQLSMQQRILVRVAPKEVPSGFGVKMAGRPTQFGIEETDAGGALQAMREMDGIRVVGLHAFSGTQCLNPSAIAENYRIYIELFRHLGLENALNLEKCIFGSGLGIPYHDGDGGINLLELADSINPVLERARKEQLFTSTVFVLETGRFLIGESGYYLTSVIRHKRSRGHEIAICDGGMNHNLGACGHLGTVIRRNYPMELLGPESTVRPRTRQDIVGPLCTSIDLLGHNIEMPQLRKGDVVAVLSSGAYGLSASPVRFISHPSPRELLLSGVPPAHMVEDISE